MITIQLPGIQRVLGKLRSTLFRQHCRPRAEEALLRPPQATRPHAADAPSQSWKRRSALRSARPTRPAMLWTSSKALRYCSVPVVTIFKNLSVVAITVYERVVYSDRSSVGVLLSLLWCAR